MSAAQVSQRPAQANAEAELRRMVILPQFERLAAALVDAETRLACARNSSKDATRIELCQGLLEQARSAIGSGGVWRAAPREFLAWDCLAQFDRQMLHLVSQEELHSIWLSVKAEADEKLTGHRKRAVADIVEHANKAALTVSSVEAALRHLQTHSQNQYYKLGQLRRQIGYVGVFLLVLILGLLLAAGFETFERFWPALDRKLQLGTLLGLVGGVLSVAFTVSRTDEKAKIPKLLASSEVMLVRPLIGASLALPVALFADSGLISVAGINERAWLVAIACFLAGFSERWFLGLVEGLEKRTAQASERKAGDGK
jgi:hypothetical protein